MPVAATSLAQRSADSNWQIRRLGKEDCCIGLGFQSTSLADRQTRLECSNSQKWGPRTNLYTANSCHGARRQIHESYTAEWYAAVEMLA